MRAVVSHFASLAAPAVTHAEQMSIKALFRMLARPIERPAGDVAAQLPLFSFASFRRHRRSNENVCYVTALALDVDQPTDEATLRKALAGYRAIAHTTKSSTRDAQRWRVVIPVAATIGAEDYGRAWAAVAEQFAAHGVTVDPATKDPARAWFPPVAGADGSFASFETNGAKLDPFAVREKTKKKARATDEKSITNGARNATLTSIAGRMRREGATKDEIKKELSTINERDVDPPLAAKEVDTIARSVARYAPSPLRQCTDTANARRFARTHHDCARFVPEWRKWLVWDGTRWAVDVENILVTKLAKRVVRRMFKDAAGILDEDEQSAAIKWAKSSASRGKLDAMVALAPSEKGMTVTPRDLDRDPWILPCKNGVVDLRTGELREQRRDDFNTRALEISYDAEAECPTWFAFLARVLPSPELRCYVQRVAGYLLTAEVREHALFFFWGSGANGKSVFTSTLLSLLGPYAMKAPPDVLFRARGERHPTDIASMYGARLVLANEIEQNRAIDEARVKDLTGGDRVTARRMREDFWSYEPTAKFLINGNHKPVIRGIDEGIWRRIRLVPFTVTIPPEERDHALSTKLRAELPGILAWAVCGCLAWQKRGGLDEPPEVVEATKDYRAASDIIGQWVATCCTPDPSAKTGATRLYKSFADWCKATGEREISQRQFGEMLALRGDLQRKKTKTGWLWLGLSLQDDDEVPDAAP